MLKYLLLTLAILSACSGSEDRPELADKLKPILVEINPGPRPQAAVFGETVTLDFHFISPDLASELTAEAREPRSGSNGLPVLGVESTEVTDYPGLRHFRIRTTAVVPLLSSELPVKMRYALDVSDGNRTVAVEGDFPAYLSAESVGADWSVAGSGIIAPASEQAISGGAVDILASINNPHQEAIKVGWFVSAGEVLNRRDAESRWDLPGAGEYTLVFTVRGQKSRTAVLQIVTVQSQ